ncbi:Cell division septal protein [Streptococcus suis 98HAH33]|nr:Cell division septal protein [Streptococcus suis 98HAH33]
MIFLPKVVWKAIPVLVTSLLTGSSSLVFYFSNQQEKTHRGVGNERLTAEQVENYSLISPG